MWRLNLFLGHPLTWIGLLVIIISTLLYYKFKKLAITSIFLSAIISLSLTNKGSEVWMDSIANIANVEEIKCENTLTKSAILLPGGVVWLRDGSRVMTEWSAVRVKAVISDIEKGMVSELIIPGGYVSGELNEGLRLKIEIENRLEKDIKERIKIQVGAGSQSTYGNYIEILSLVDRNMEYLLYTSSWHMYRAFNVAKKLGINVCPVIIINPHDNKKSYASTWKLKAAVREYIAIIWYAIKGQI